MRGLGIGDSAGREGPERQDGQEDHPEPPGRRGWWAENSNDNTRHDK